MPEVILRVGNAEPEVAQRLSALASLSDDLRDAGLETVVDPRLPDGRDVTWYEVTLIYIGMKLADAVTGKIADGVTTLVWNTVVAWLKKGDRRGDPARPRVVHLYAPDGTILKTIRQENDEIVDD